MPSEKLIFESYEHGMNSRTSSRMLYKYIAGNRYGGPFPVMKNLDRGKGYLEPAGSAEKIGSTNYSRVRAMHVQSGFTDDNINAATDDNIYIAIHDASLGNKIARLYNTSPYNSRWMHPDFFANSLTQEIRFADLGEYILAYNSVDSRVIRTVNDYKSGDTWEVKWDDGVALAYMEVAHSPKLPWATVTTRWIHKMITFKLGSTWYHTHIDQALFQSNNTLTKFYMNNDGPIFSAATVGTPTNITIHGLDSAFIPAPTVTPQVEVYTAGTGLSGTYEYAFTYGTYDGFESDLSPWSAEVTPSNQGVMVYGFGVGSGLDIMVDRIHVYRRGGSLGTTTARVTTLYLPHRYNTDTTTAKYFADLSATARATAVNCSGTTCLSTWPTYGVAYIPDDSYSIGKSGSSIANSDLVKYTRVDATTQKKLTGTVTHKYGGSTAADYTIGQTIVLDSILDTTVDSDLGTTEAPLDHGDLPTSITSACMSGNRLYAVEGESYGSAGLYRPTNRVFISSSESWRYFRSATQSEVYDLDDQFTGGYVDVGPKGQGIVKVISYRPGMVLAFSATEVYMISGRSIPSMRIELLTNFPGCSASDSVCICDLNLVWLHNNRVWMWDGGEMLVELTENIDALEGSTVQNLDDCVGYYWDHKYFLTYDKSGDSFPFANYICWDFRRLTTYGNTNMALPSATIGDYMPGRQVAVSSKTQIPYGVGGGTTQGYIYKLHGQGTNKWNNDTDFANRVWQVQLPDVPIGNGMQNGLLQGVYLQAHSDASMPTASFTFTPRLDSVNQTARTFTFNRTGASNAQAQQSYKHLTKSYRASNVGGTFTGTVEKWTATASVRRIERFAIESGEVRENTKDL